MTNRHPGWTGHGDANPARLLQAAGEEPAADTIEGLKAAALLRRAHEEEERGRALTRREAEARRLWGELLRQFGRDWPALAVYAPAAPPEEFFGWMEDGYAWCRAVVAVSVPAHETVYTLYTSDRERQAWSQEERFAFSAHHEAYKYGRWVTAHKFAPGVEEESGYATHGDDWFTSDDLGDALLAAAEGFQSRKEAEVKGRGLANARRLQAQQPAPLPPSDDEILGAALRRWMGRQIIDPA